MSQEKRKFERHDVQLDIELGFPSGDSQQASTRDVSDGGIFVVLEQSLQPIIGEVLTVKLLDDSHQLATKFPSDDAVVVRQEQSGIGLAFIELDFNEDS